MKEEFILLYIPERMKQLGYVKWHIQYRHLRLGSGEAITFSAYNELFFIVNDPEPDMFVYSDYGWYSSDLQEVKYEHRGEITIYNGSGTIQRIKLIQVTIVN